MSERDARRPGASADYVRFAALGDSATFGLGDRVGDGWRGWARILADSLAEAHHLSFWNVAASGATASDVRGGQLGVALAHQPDLASLVVGLNDTMRSSWDATRVRDDLVACATALAAAGAMLLTVRFHDHSRVLPLPRFLARAMSRRIEAVNDIYDEIQARFGGIQLDLATATDPYDRRFWSVDRLHPSEHGHRVLARAVSEALVSRGIPCPPPSLTCTGTRPSRLDEARWLLTQGVPWVGRRARDFGGRAARQVVPRPGLRPVV